MMKVNRRFSSCWIAIFSLIAMTCALATAVRCRADDGPVAFTIVSDIDDTIKITNVLNKVSAVENGVFGKKTFLGMAELYQELVKSAAAAAGSSGGSGKAPKPAVVYMSGSPPFLGHSISKMLVNEHHFPSGTFIYRRSMDQPIYDFKSAHFKELADKYPQPFLSLGDDTEKDPEVLHDFAVAQPGSKNVALYIHRVTGRALPSGVTPYHTAFDVALMEYEAGRLTEEQAARIANTILGANQPTLLFPSFTECPKDFSYPLSARVSQSAVLTRLKADMVNYVTAYCAVRGTHKKFVAPARLPEVSDAHE